METSASIEQIATALAKFQSEVPKVAKDGVNPHFKSKFATLENLIETIRDPLAKNGLSFSQLPTGDSELATIIMHKSGEWIRATAKIELAKRDPQGQGSGITYMRRYALSAAFGLATEDDDDGNTASDSRKPAARPAAKPAPASKKTDDPDTKKAVMDAEKRLTDATSLDEMKKVWASLPAPIRVLVQKTKDEVKKRYEDA